ncbi:MAG: hypothetical protein U0I02_06380 [Eubacterium sp.]|uniref:hypothetical protein n=1 Tax=Eubacterium sp. TaxID=142586 RepID=UPI002EB6BDBF|nr:hypothetical protein [Eubacterium sp.]
MSKESKHAKKEAKAAKKAAKAEKAASKMAAKAEKKHSKDYNKFVKKATKKNNKKANKPGYAAIVIPPIDEYQSKSEIKLAKANDKAYAAYVKKINKKNTKMEAKCAKKGKPFEPIPIPEKDEVVLQTNKKRKVWRMIIRILLIWLIVYFIIMWLMYSPAILPTEADDTTAAASYDYEPYSNPHEITTTPDYTIAEAKVFLKQVIHDNWKNIGYSSDVSNDAITYNNKTIVVNNANCYVFSCAGKTYAIPIKLSGCYVLDNGEYKPLTFDNTNYLF